jgi:hypothetical protein
MGAGIPRTDPDQFISPPPRPGVIDVLPVLTRTAVAQLTVSPTDAVPQEGEGPMHINRLPCRAIALLLVPLRIGGMTHALVLSQILLMLGGSCGGSCGEHTRSHPIDAAGSVDTLVPGPPPTGTTSFDRIDDAFARGLISALAAPVAAAEPVILTTPLPTLTTTIALSPAIKPGELDLRVRTLPQVAAAPTVEVQDANGGPVRQMLLTADGDAWSGKVTAVPTHTAGCIYVTAEPAGGSPELYTLRFTTRGIAKGRAALVYSADGQFGLVLLDAQVVADASFLITTAHPSPSEQLNPLLPVGETLAAGPFTLMVLPQDVADLSASVLLRLPDAASPTPTYRVRWLNVAAKTWDLMPELGGPNPHVAQASITHPGTFVLTAEAP